MSTDSGIFILPLNGDTNIRNANTILLDRFTNNVRPSNEEIAKGDFFYANLINALLNFKSRHLTEELELNLCNYTINRIWEIKKVIFLLFKDRHDAIYTPCVPSNIGTCPDMLTNPLEFPTDWEKDKIHRRDLARAAYEIIVYLTNLYKLYLPDVTEERIDFLVSNYSIDLDLKAFCAYECVT